LTLDFRPEIKINLDICNRYINAKQFWMITKIAALLVFLTIGNFNLTSEKTSQNQDYDQYCNVRFNYCLYYPKFLNPQPESANGDGRIFFNKKGDEVLRVFGRFNLDAEGETITLERQYKIDVQDNLKKKNIITYKKLGKTFFVISGYRNGKIFYQKTILKNDAFAFAILQYPKDEKEIYDKVSAEIFKSFK